MKKNLYFIILQAMVIITTIATTIWLEKKPPIKKSPPNFKNFYNTLERDGINAKQRLDGFYINYNKLLKIPGWEIIGVKMIEQVSVFWLRNDGGTLHQLKTWSNNNGYLHNINSDGISIASAIKNIPPMRQALLIPTTDSSWYIQDAVSRFIPTMRIEFGKDEGRGSYQQRNVSFLFDKLQKEHLVDLGTILDGLPISFEKAELTLHNKNLKGRVDFLLIGE